SLEKKQAVTLLGLGSETGRPSSGEPQAQARGSSEGTRESSDGHPVARAPGSPRPPVAPGPADRGFLTDYLPPRSWVALVEPGVVALGSHELFHRDLLPPGVKGPALRGSRQVESRAIDTFLDLNEGDYVVHVAHGIARFRGMRMLKKARSAEFGTGSEE